MYIHHMTDPDALVGQVHKQTGIDKDVILRILLWELEVRDRQYLTPDNYVEFMSDDLADLLELPRDLVYRILEAEKESLGIFDDKEKIIPTRIE